ncbi:hypothetical protein WDU94_000194 [Cyamophila willieti]
MSPSATEKSDDIEYVPSSTKNEEYIPSATEKSDDIQYIPSSTKNEEYIPSATEKSDDIQYIPSSTKNEEYIPSTTEKSDDIQYIPSSTKNEKYIPSTTEKSDDIQYIPSSTKNEKYIPSRTNKMDVECVPTESNKSDDVEYIPSSTCKKEEEYVPSATKRSDDLEYTPSSRNEVETEYVPFSTQKVDEKIEYVPSQYAENRRKLEYVPSRTQEMEDMEYVPSSTSSEIDSKLEYVPSSTEKSDPIEYVPTNSSELVRSEDVYVPSITSPLEEYVPVANPSSSVIVPPEYTPTKTEEYTPIPMEVEYVPTGIRNSLDYTPTPTSTEHISNEQTGVIVNTITSTNNDTDRIESADKGEGNSDIKTNGKIPKESVEELTAERNMNGGVSGAGNGTSSDLVEVEEVDDYLLYLEEILKHIHQKFYATFDQIKKESQGEHRTIPDLKHIIPNMRSVVLSGCHLVFSGVVPSKMKLEENKAYSVARALGAEVSDRITLATTHLVAVRIGTAKVNEAKRRKDILIVTLDWLWMCAERWERVDERLFPVVSTQSSSSRTPPAHCASPPHPPPSPPQQQQFSDSINPLMALSSEDLANMDREVEDIFNETDDDDDDKMMRILRIPKGRKLASE